MEDSTTTDNIIYKTRSKSVFNKRSSFMPRASQDMSDFHERF